MQEKKESDSARGRKLTIAFSEFLYTQTPEANAIDALPGPLFDEFAAIARLLESPLAIAAAAKGFLAKHHEGERVMMAWGEDEGRKLGERLLEVVSEGIMADIKGDVRQCPECGGRHTGPGPLCPVCQTAHNAKIAQRNRQVVQNDGGATSTVYTGANIPEGWQACEERDKTAYFSRDAQRIVPIDEAIPWDSNVPIRRVAPAVNKGGVNPPPTTPKPDVAPAGQSPLADALTAAQEYFAGLAPQPGEQPYAPDFPEVDWPRVGPELAVACQRVLKAIDRPDCDVGHVWLNYPNKPEQTPISILRAALAKVNA